MSKSKLIWTGARETLEQLSVLLSEVLYPPADAVSLLKDDAAKSEEGADWSLHAYFQEFPDIDALTAMTSDYDLTLLAPEKEAIPDIDWVAHSLAGLGIVEAGKFVLFGAHDTEKAAALPGFKLQIEANRAFGTGHHPTTAGCLEALSRLEPTAPKKILDVGTGSGVLAIAARCLWPEGSILATDIDAPSVQISAENAELNRTENIEFIEAEGLDDTVYDKGPYALIIANILAGPLIELAQDISNCLTPNGHVVLAGLLARQEVGITKAYEEHGLYVVDRIVHDTWPVLVLRP